MVSRRPVLLIVALLALLLLMPQFGTQDVSAQILGEDWTATFFDNTSFSGDPIATAQLPDGISCNWTDGVTDCARSSQPEEVSGVGKKNYSVRFNTTYAFAQSGNYMFTLRYNDGMRMTLNGEVIHDDLNEQPVPDSNGTCAGLCKQVQVTRNIAEGPMSMQVDYVQYTGTAIIQVQWGFTGGGTPPQPELVNGNFEQNLDGWTLKNASSDKVKCNTETKTYSYKGDCAFRFKGVPGESAELAQTLDGKFYSAAPILLEGYVNADGTVNSNIKVIASYPDSNFPKDKLVIHVSSPTGGYVPVQSLSPTSSLNLTRTPAKIKLVLSNSGESGKVYYDKLNLSSSGLRHVLLLAPLP